jgi:P27 family predicted phage terminase small subunit
MRGPSPAPSALKLLRGNPGRRPVNDREPKPNAERDPHCPDHLDETAKVEWSRLLPILRDMRVLTEADYIALALLCSTYSTLIKAQESLNKAGLLFKTPSGYVQQSPLIGIISNCTAQVNTLCREFGLTPSARTRIMTADDKTQEKADDPWRRLKSLG